MSSYETAPATKLVATHCAVCARPLVDATSVEFGIGPTCREKYGFNVEVAADVRRNANRTIHNIAIGAYQNNGLVEALSYLRFLGFAQLAEIISVNRRKFEIVELPSKELAVKGPMKDAAIAEWRRIPGRRWDSASGGFVVPPTARRLLWNILQRHFRGTLGMGPKGLFVVA